MTMIVIYSLQQCHSDGCFAYHIGFAAGSSITTEVFVALHGSPLPQVCLNSNNNNSKRNRSNTNKDENTNIMKQNIKMERNGATAAINVPKYEAKLVLMTRTAAVPLTYRTYSMR